MSIKIKAHIFACKKCNCKDCELYLCTPYTCDKYNKYVKLYEEIATEQKQIDINKACELIIDIVEDLMARYCETWAEESKKKTLENIRKTMEK